MIRLAAAATISDLLTFALLLAIAGPAGEANPLVSTAITTGLLAYVILAKVALVVAIALWPRAVGRYRGLVGLTGLLIGGLGAISNLLAILP